MNEECHLPSCTARRATAARWVAETSCEMRNDYLDRALVVPVLGVPDAAFFRPLRMIDALLTLPSHQRKRLESALLAGSLAPPYQAAAVLAEVGHVAEGRGGGEGAARARGRTA